MSSRDAVCVIPLFEQAGVITVAYKVSMGAFDLDNGMPRKSVYVEALSFAHLTGNSENIKQFVLVCLVLVWPPGKAGRSNATE